MQIGGGVLLLLMLATKKKKSACLSPRASFRDARVSSHCATCDICGWPHYPGALPPLTGPKPRTVKGSAGERHIMTSLACPALPAVGPGALLRRGTHRRTPFSQHSACDVVFSPHNAALHAGFITPCQSAGEPTVYF